MKQASCRGLCQEGLWKFLVGRKSKIKKNIFPGSLEALISLIKTAENWEDAPFHAFVTKDSEQFQIKADESSGKIF